MSDYFCLTCGGRTGMMGHGENHDRKLMRLIERLAKKHGVSRAKVAAIVGQWQIGELELPSTPAPTPEGDA